MNVEWGCPDCAFENDKHSYACQYNWTDDDQELENYIEAVREAAISSGHMIVIPVGEL